jgi:hypothetical protein
MSDDSTGEQHPESLLPYDQWTSDALREVIVRALSHVAAAGLPGAHHFYITFRTDAPGVNIPARLKAQYPHEMTIVLQHQFRGLRVDEQAGTFDVTLSFSGVSSPLHIPFAAVIAFADPHVDYRLGFASAAPAPEEQPEEQPRALPAPDHAPDEPQPDATPQVVSLDAFRRRPTPPGRDT